MKKIIIAAVLYTVDAILSVRILVLCLVVGATAGKHACCEHYGKRECHKFILYHNSSPCVYSSPYYICICQTCKSRPYISARGPPSPALTSRTLAKKEPPRYAPAGVLKPNLYLKEEEKF